MATVFIREVMMIKVLKKISNTGYRGVRDSTVAVEIVVVSIEDDNKY